MSPYLMMFSIFIVVPVIAAILLVVHLFRHRPGAALDRLRKLHQHPHQRRRVHAKRHSEHAEIRDHRRSRRLYFCPSCSPGCSRSCLRNCEPFSRSSSTSPSLTSGVTMGVVWKVIFAGDATGYLNSILMRLGRHRRTGHLASIAGVPADRS
ncbi:MAG: hypothetical protein MZU97_00445 [Bacillus subtilis]|nr:hypothetical protein [Bacillus subtilis]